MTTREKIEWFRKGNMIIVTDDDDRENEGDLMISSQCADDSDIAFMARFGRGLICMPIERAKAEQLSLPYMTDESTCPHHTAFTISVDAKKGTTTGISAGDRIKTVKTILDGNSEPDDLIRPGHLFPLIAVPGGLKERRGHTEAAVELSRLAGHLPSGLICEIMNDDGTMKRGKELEEFAGEHKLPILSIEELVRYMESSQDVHTFIPTVHGDFELYHFDSGISDSMPHIAMVHREADLSGTVTVRLHSECLTGDLFGSLRCDCGDQLRESMKILNEEKGILLYMRQEGRGIGLVRKMEAYRFQDQGYDTVDANLILGHSPDEREYGEAARILKKLGAVNIELLTNNPHKIDSLRCEGINVAGRRALETGSNKFNLHYLNTKKRRMNHLLTLKEN